MPATTEIITETSDGRRYRRRWRVPPPFLLGPEPIEGAGILEELPGPLGLLLWQCMRDATLWGMTPREEREGLFSADAEHRRLAALLVLGAQAREVEEPLRALAVMLSHAPDTPQEVVLLACQRIAQWADARGATATALAFAQAAALAAPGSARAALRVGQLARRRGEYARSEGWLQRAVVLARQNREREVHAWAYTALGTLHYLRGNLPGAERLHFKALRIAERWGLRNRTAAAQHDLFVVYAETGRAAEANAQAARAFHTYGPRHAKLPTLAHDVATFWVNDGQFARALPVLKAVWPHMSAYQHILAFSNIARAAGAVSDQLTFEQYYARTLVAAESSANEAHPTALINLARGAVSIGALDRAEAMARRAIELAVRLDEHKTRFEAEALLDSLTREQLDARCMQIASSPVGDVVADELAGELTDSLLALST